MVIVPFLGILIYMIARPKMTEQDRQMMMEARSSSAACRDIRRG